MESFGAILGGIAYYEGVLGTKWGPCIGSNKKPCDCVACEFVNEFEKYEIDEDWAYENRIRLNDLSFQEIKTIQDNEL